MSKGYTDHEATDEAMLMLVRRMRRLVDSETFNKIWGSLGDDIQDAIVQAENRADLLRSKDSQAGIKRKFVTISDKVDAELTAHGESI